MGGGQACTLDNVHCCPRPSQEPIKSRAPQLHLEYRFYKQLSAAGTLELCVCVWGCDGRPTWALGIS